MWDALLQYATLDDKHEEGELDLLTPVEGQLTFANVQLVLATLLLRYLADVFSSVGGTDMGNELLARTERMAERHASHPRLPHLLLFRTAARRVSTSAFLSNSLPSPSSLLRMMGAQLRDDNTR